MIKVLLASPRWYCAGVHRAIQIVDKAIKEYGTPLYVNHEIIHNRFIVSSFEKKWVIFWCEPEDIDAGNIMIFSAHWVGPTFIKRVQKQWLSFIDASCPLVLKVHTEVKKYISEWFEIIYIGKKGHQEAEWILEENNEKIHIVSKIEDIDERIILDKKYALLTQTTLSVSETKELIEKIQEKIPSIVLPPKEDICYATTNRQLAVSEISKECDLFFVVWSKNSSNSNKLQLLAQKNTQNHFW